MCRYTVQNAKALSEARTALETGEIRTPSYCSKWSSDSTGTDEVALGRNNGGCSSTEASSGEEYRVSRADGSSSGGSGSTDHEDSEQPATSRLRKSLDEEEDTCTSTDTSNSEGSWKTVDEEEETCTSTDTCSTKGRWEADDRSTTPASDTDNTAEVCPKHNMEELCVVTR